RALTGVPDPLPDLRSLPPGRDAGALRERLAAELAAARVPAAKALDMLLAATEVAANAWRYGGGPSELRVGRVDGRFVCEISDNGPGFDDPLAGYIPPGPGETASGLWIVRQLTWRQELFPSDRGFTVRLWL
ncbi:MAG: ATP-binding protein, partial [Solirubrobacteraceae bacterium]